MILRPLETSDLEVVVRIQRYSPEASQWRLEDYITSMDENSRGWLAVVDAMSGADEKTGFIFVRLIVDEIEILNLAVLPAHRRKKIGRALLIEALQWARQRGAKTAWLEVRASNSSAIAFYEGAGFQAVSRRTRYYRDPVENAVNLSLNLSDE